MADNDQEKTEYLSQKKLEESREKGELPKSQELGTFIVFALFLTYFTMTQLELFDGMGAIMADLLTFDRHMHVNQDTLSEFMVVPVVKTVGLIAPLFGLILFFSPLVSMTQTGFNIAKDKLTPDWNRLNPTSGFKRIFSLRQSVEGVKSCIKIALFAWLAWTAIRASLPILRMLGALDLRTQLKTMLDVTLSIGIRITIMMALMAVLDFGYQWYEFHKKLRMTPQEMKEEFKEREGNPLVKQRQRSLAMQQARERMMSNVATASVVVTNPTTYAIALTYERDKAPAPYVCAKGMRRMAEQIKKLARKHNVPIVENKPLARALYKKAKVGKVIPSEFYKTVAEVLAFVFLLKKNSGGKGAWNPTGNPMRMPPPQRPVGRP